MRLTGGVSLHSPENVVLKADEAEYNQRTGETVLRGSVVLRQDLGPASQATPATNRAGEHFPAPKDVVMRMTGGVQIVINDMTVRADEANVNGLTGEMVLRGNVVRRYSATASDVDHTYGRQSERHGSKQLPATCFATPSFLFAEPVLPDADATHPQGKRRTASIL